MAEIRRILIATKYRFIGDTLLSVPTIRATAKLWPDAKITLLTGSKALEIVQNCPYVHDAVEFDPYRSSDQGILPFLITAQKLRRCKFDLALVLNRSFHSALISTWGGARLRAGWGGFAHRDFMLDITCRYRSEDSEIDSYLDILACAYRAFGYGKFAEEFDRRLELWLTAEERAAIPSEITGPGRFIGIQPGATHSYKRWALDKFAALGDMVLSSVPDAKLVLIGGPDECDVANELLAHCTDRVLANTVNLTGKLSLRGTLAALDRLSYFVANDTAIRHAAVALGVPSLGLFGPTSALKWGNAAPPVHRVLATPTGNLDDLTLACVLDEVGSALKYLGRVNVAPTLRLSDTSSPAAEVVPPPRVIAPSGPEFRAIMVTTKYRYMGDTLLTGPALRAIRRRWPNAHVTLLTGPPAAELMRNCPYVDKIIAFHPQARENQGLNLYSGLVARLRHQGVEAAFIYNTSAHAAITPWLAKVPFRLGWRGFDNRDLFLTDSMPYNDERNELDSNVDMIRHVVPEIEGDGNVELWLTDEELDDIPESIRINEPIVGLQPGATNDRKRWPAASFAELAQMLLDRGFAERIAVLGGPDEIEAGQELLDCCSEKVLSRTINLVGKTRMRQSLAVLRRLKFFVGNDTAVRHITVALDVPSIGLFGPTNPCKWGNHNSPRQEILVSATGIMSDLSPRAVIDQIDCQMAEETGRVVLRMS